MKQQRFLMGLIIFLVLTFQPAAHSKELASRLGIGYKNQFAVDLPSVAAEYYPNADIGMSAALGLYTGTDNSKFGLMFHIHRIVFPEERMNFYMGAGAGLLSSKVGGTNESGFELQGFVGGEFFLPGLDSLGISFEAGIGIVSTTSGVTFRTFGDSPVRAGMIFYF